MKKIILLIRDKDEFLSLCPVSSICYCYYKQRILPLGLTEKKKQKTTRENEREISDVIQREKRHKRGEIKNRERPLLYSKSKVKRPHTREDTLNTFKQVKVNFSLLEAIKQIPTCAKFLQDMCTFKRKSKDYKSQKVFLSEEVNSILKFDTPSKLEDPCVSTTSYSIDNHKIERALLD